VQDTTTHLSVRHRSGHTSRLYSLKVHKQDAPPDSVHHVSSEEERKSAERQAAETDIGCHRDLETLLLQKIQSLTGECIAKQNPRVS